MRSAYVCFVLCTIANYQYFQNRNLQMFWKCCFQKQPTQCCPLVKVLWKYTANIQENTHVDVRFQQSCFTTCFATLLKSNFGMGVLLQICYRFSQHLFPSTPLDSCFCVFMKANVKYGFVQENDCKSFHEFMQN